MKQIALKFIILGDGAVGKTTLLHRYVKGEFIDTTTMTIGVEFLTKQIEIETLTCQLILWDITGQERFRHLIEPYMRGASGALILFDITNMTSFVNIGKWMSLINKYYKNLPVILVAAKYDLQEFSMVGDLYAVKTQKRFDLLDYVKTSSKTGFNVELPFELLAKHVVKSNNVIAT